MSYDIFEVFPDTPLKLLRVQTIVEKNNNGDVLNVKRLQKYMIILAIWNFATNLHD